MWHFLLDLILQLGGGEGGEKESERVKVGNEKNNNKKTKKQKQKDNNNNNNKASIIIIITTTTTTTIIIITTDYSFTIKHTALHIHTMTKRTTSCDFFSFFSFFPLLIRKQVFVGTYGVIDSHSPTVRQPTQEAQQPAHFLSVSVCNCHAAQAKAEITCS